MVRIQYIYKYHLYQWDAKKKCKQCVALTNGALRAMSRRNQNKRPKIVKVFFTRRIGRRFRRLCELNYITITKASTMARKYKHTHTHSEERDSRQPKTAEEKKKQTKQWICFWTVKWSKLLWFSSHFIRVTLFFRSYGRSDRWMEHFVLRCVCVRLLFCGFVFFRVGIYKCT